MQFYMLSWRVDICSTAPPPDDIQAHWRKVLTELRLTEQQRNELVACWEINSQNMVRVREKVNPNNMQVLTTNQTNVPYILHSIQYLNFARTCL